MRTVVIAVGRVRAPFSDDVAHYRKLLAPRARLELIELREPRDAARRVPRDAFVCLLASEGRSFSSVDFASFLDDRRRSGKDLCFVIGGPRGEIELESFDLLLSLGPLTLPFQLARVVLLEQLFRADKILAREPYHY